MKYTYQLMDMRTIHPDGSMGDLTPQQHTGKNVRLYHEISVRTPLDLGDKLRELFCKMHGVNTTIHFNGAMAHGAEPEVRVYVGRVLGTEGPRDDGIVVTATLLRVSN